MRARTDRVRLAALAMVERPRNEKVRMSGADSYYDRLKRKVVRLPRWARLVTGVLLVLFGLLGFLPVLGFWMVPLGLVVLSVDLAPARRLRRRLEVWWERRRRRS